jgi:hypothetical protein
MVPNLPLAPTFDGGLPGQAVGGLIVRERQATADCPPGRGKPRTESSARRHPGGPAGIRACPLLFWRVVCTESLYLSMNGPGCRSSVISRLKLASVFFRKTQEDTNYLSAWGGAGTSSASRPILLHRTLAMIANTRLALHLEALHGQLSQTHGPKTGGERGSCQPSEE